MPSPAPGRTSWSRICLLLVLFLPLAACGAGAKPAQPSPEPPASAEQPVEPVVVPLETATKIRRVYGRLPDVRRKRVRHQIEKVVDKWWEASYVGGTYPRDDFRAAFPGFTSGSEKRAREDKDLLTNQVAGPLIESVTPKHRSVSLDILAVDGHARSVTARFVLRFRTTGAREGITVVRGRLLLTRRNGAWRIFGYDVAKGNRS